MKHQRTQVAKFRRIDLTNKVLLEKFENSRAERKSRSSILITGRVDHAPYQDFDNTQAIVLPNRNIRTSLLPDRNQPEHREQRKPDLFDRKLTTGSSFN
ncbi:hypothetical protein ACJIZ3_014042 [Penstemon smallii]|uniref:Uncharacterized protein n=1 Tax=Penstemon smallii TaxID=265156 RepID=A0ABD3RJ54_9LAMI